MPIKKPKKDWSSINSRIKNRKKKFKADERIFVPTFNDKNQAKVIMRFLDSKDTELPYVEQAGHFFNDVGGWFIDNCPTTIHGTGKGICPVCDDLYANNYYETDYDLYSDRSKNTYFYMNALIIEDKNCPDNEGKVFIFKFGKKLMEKVDDAIEDDKFIWDEDAGVNFTFSAKKKGKMSNYDASYFSDSTTSIDEYGDVDKILDLRHDLAGFVDESEFKSFDELKTKYDKVVGETTGGETSKPKRSRKIQEDDIEDEEIVDDDDTDTDIGDENMYDETDDDDDSFFDDLEDDDE